MVIKNVYKVIICEYIEGSPIPNPINNKSKIIADISDHLSEIHRLGFIYGDVRLSNIILAKNRYILIDYGRCFFNRSFEISSNGIYD